MRGSLAKKIRRHVYGDNSIRTREYQDINGPFRKRFFTEALAMNGEPEFVEKLVSGTIVNTGLRRKYQSLKTALKHHKRTANP